MCQIPIEILENYVIPNWSQEIYVVFSNIYFEEHLRTSASEL